VTSAAETTTTHDRARSAQLREQRLVERLVAAGEALSAELLDRARIAHIVLHEAVEAFGAPLAGVFLVDGDRLRTLAHHGARHELLESMERMPLDTPGWAAGDAVRRGTPIFLSSEEALEAAYPEIHELPVRSGYRGGLAYVPLRAGGDVLGLLGLRFDHDVALSAAERGFLRGFAHQAALALERVTAFEAEQAARRAAQEAAERERAATVRAQVLVRATEVFAHSLDASTVREVLGAIVPVAGDVAAFRVLDAPDRPGFVVSMPDDVDADRLPAGALRLRAAGIGATVLAGEEHDDGLLAALRATSAVVASIAIHGRALGWLAVGQRGAGSGVDAEQVQFVGELAHRAAAALETAQLHDDLRRIAALEMTRAHELEAVLHAVGEPILVADEEGRVRLANAAAVDAFAGDVPPNLPALRARFEDVEPGTAAGSSGQRTIEARQRTSGRWYELTEYLVAADDPSPGTRLEQVARRWLEPADPSSSDELPPRAPTSTILVLRDVTERRHAQQLREAFIGVLSHELRTPITTIFGGAQVLVREGVDEGTRREVASDVVAEAERLHRLVEDLLVIARAERGALELGGDPVLVQHVIARVVRSETPRWPSITLRVHQRSLPAVRADETYVEQILRNLVGNAAKYGGPGTEVEIVAEQGAGEVIVRVLDDGPGFLPEESRRLFELFYRAPGTAAKSGAGIGLFVCRALVEAMGGRIWALPRPAGGAEFGIALPVFADEG